MSDEGSSILGPSRLQLMLDQELPRFEGDLILPLSRKTMPISSQLTI